MSLGRTDFGTDLIIVETVKQAEMEQRLESLPSNGFVADPSQELSLLLDEQISDKSEVDQRLEPLQNMDRLSLIQKESRADLMIDVETVKQTFADAKDGWAIALSL